jgi:hypothetical protein
MARKGYVFTPARKAALRKAQLASARKRRGTGRKRYSSDPVKRGVGAHGLAKNFTPYARINKRSQTVGFNTGTIIPFSGKRVAFGNYVRFESTNRNKNPVDKAVRKFSRRGTKPGAVRQWLGNNVEVKNPAVRVTLPHSQARLGTSRGAGPTLILRARRHQTPFRKSRGGVRRFDRRMRAVAGKRVKTRAQRRGK